MVLWAIGRSGGRVLTLAEACDGSPSPCPAEHCLGRLDDQALYIAARHPVSDAPLTPGPSPAREKVVQAGICGTSLTAWRSPCRTRTRLPRRGSAGTASPTAPHRRRGNADVSARIGGACLDLPMADSVCRRVGYTAHRTQVRLDLAVRHAAEDDWACWRGTGAATSNVALAGTLVFPEELAAKFSPPQDGLLVWLDAADAATIEKDAAGNVAAWKDKSGKAGRRPAGEAAVPSALRGGRPERQAGPPLCGEGGHASGASRPVRREDDGHCLCGLQQSGGRRQKNANPRIFTASDGRRLDYQVGISLNLPGMETGGPRQMMAVFPDRWAKKVARGLLLAQLPHLLHRRHRRNPRLPDGP